MKKTKVEIRIIALRIANPYNILRQITNLPQQKEHPPQQGEPNILRQIANLSQQKEHPPQRGTSAATG